MDRKLSRKKFAQLFGISLPVAVGHLHYFWWWALDFAQDGLLDKFDHYDLADAMQWDGDLDLLVESLISSGYIDDTEDGLVIHDWGEYAGSCWKDMRKTAPESEQRQKPQAFRSHSEGTPTEKAKKPKELRAVLS